VSIIEGKSDDPIDFIATDSINSPIDADKLDYIKRDSYYCGVSYGDGIDYDRFMNFLTVKETNNQVRLAYYAKGRTAISSMLLARYQLYGAIYWHHTYRCLHAMLYYATQLAFDRANYDGFSIFINKSKTINMEELRKFYYYRVICKLSWKQAWEKVNQDFKHIETSYGYLKKELKEELSLPRNDYSLDFIYRFSDSIGKRLLMDLLNRKLYKRIYSKSLQDLEDISLLIQQCENRVEISKRIQKGILEAVKRERAASQRTETSAEIMVSAEIVKLEEQIDQELYILVDFPTKIKMQKKDWPKEIDDSSRKLQNYGGDNPTEILTSSNKLLSEVACLRVYAEPNFFSIIIRELHPESIESCVRNVISII